MNAYADAIHKRFSFVPEIDFLHQTPEEFRARLAKSEDPKKWFRDTTHERVDEDRSLKRTSTSYFALALMSYRIDLVRVLLEELSQQSLQMQNLSFSGLTSSILSVDGCMSAEFITTVTTYPNTASYDEFLKEVNTVPDDMPIAIALEARENEVESESALAIVDTSQNLMTAELLKLFINEIYACDFSEKYRDKLLLRCRVAFFSTHTPEVFEDKNSILSKRLQDAILQQAEHEVNHAHTMEYTQGPRILEELKELYTADPDTEASQAKIAYASKLQKKARVMQRLEKLSIRSQSSSESLQVLKENEDVEISASTLLGILEENVKEPQADDRRIQDFLPLLPRFAKLREMLKTSSSEATHIAHHLQHLNRYASYRYLNSTTADQAKKRSSAVFMMLGALQLTILQPDHPVVTSSSSEDELELRQNALKLKDFLDRQSLTDVEYATVFGSEYIKKGILVGVITDSNFQDVYAQQFKTSDSTKRTRI